MTQPIIEFKNATLKNGENEVLKNINLAIYPGEFVYLIGKIGTGKSTLIRSLNAELPLHKGQIVIDGTLLWNIRRKNVAPLRKKLGVVFQDYKLLSDRSVYKNLLFVLEATEFPKKERKERIEEVLLKTGVLEHKDKMPHELSGGEQQRVVIARALLNNPDIILADEPTGNLDPETSYALAALLHDISKSGKTVIMATHQYDLLERFPARTLRCENHQIIEQ
ncbi:cell division transport system ATP-binding protein [Balneicella halophila]|uniref:Cell division transport system ATP-binding protein n=1 Tax=Balneicella halophila TaxID=1537566 RepID=A0A7L4URJ0_BALHA|nr:ATP-binding cassette domain-containing protein [Balneicella halophila]PVX52279.1 cell division transport system ATP-binding protein [Balneicella halophila]